MEPFFDGGLIELFVVMTLGLALNYIFLRKYLLIGYSIFVLACPVLLFAFRNTELFHWLVAVCLLHSVLLVVLLWKEKKQSPGKNLFDVEGMKTRLRNPARPFQGSKSRRKKLQKKPF